MQFERFAVVLSCFYNLFYALATIFEGFDYSKKNKILVEIYQKAGDQSDARENLDLIPGRVLNIRVFCLRGANYTVVQIERRPNQILYRWRPGFPLAGGTPIHILYRELNG